MYLPPFTSSRVTLLTLSTALIVVYEYHPLACTLQTQFNTYSKPGTSAAVPFKPTSGDAADGRALWMYLLQVASAVRTMYGRGMALRRLGPKWMLVTGVGQ